MDRIRYHGVTTNHISRSPDGTLTLSVRVSGETKWTEIVGSGEALGPAITKMIELTRGFTDNANYYARPEVKSRK